VLVPEQEPIKRRNGEKRGEADPVPLFKRPKAVSSSKGGQSEPGESPCTRVRRAGENREGG